MKKLKPISNNLYMRYKTWQWMGIPAIVNTSQKNISGHIIPQNSRVTILGKTLIRPYNETPTFNSGYFNIKAQNGVEIYGVDHSSLSL